MPPILLKEVLVEIRHSLGRFLSILAIVALGASFFAGIKASVPDMKASADTYFDSLNLQDIQVYSTAGLDDEDVQAIEKLPGVEAAQGQFSMDALTRRDSREMVVKVIGLQEDQKMNTPRLAEGRLPREADECVIQMDSATGEMFGTFGLRDRIRLYSGTDDPLDDSLNESTFIIVGKAYNPNYLSYELGTSSIGSGSVDTFIYVPQDAIKADYYTEVDVKVTNADRENTYSSSYFALTDPVVDELEDIADEQVTQRIARQREKLEDAKKELASQLAGPTKELAENRVKLEQAADNIASGAAQIASNESLLYAGREELEDGQKEYDDGMAQFEEGEKEFNDRKDQADSQIADAEKQLDDLEGRWIILDRNSHYSYRDYQSCADRMDGIASVFPVFFYLVAALVCMTTMTRMVDEERNAIGTLKALGYSKGQIAFKYLAYAGTAAILGSLIGCAIGMIVFPYIIFSAWNTLYTIDHIVFTFDPALIATASLSVTGIVLLATIYSIARELKEVPSQLMRPKAAQAGKKILLERLPWLWKKVPFMHKVTLRNIFRYKKRFFMTTIGVAGCSALLVAGLGLNDSISSIVSTQYEEIYHYNTAVSGSLSENPDLKEQIEQTPGVKEVYEEQSLPITMNIQDKDQTGTLHIVQDQEALEDFVTFMKADNRHEVIHLQDEGVFVSVQAAERMNLSTGDTITFETTSGEEVKAPVAGIFEQYVGHQIYVTQKLFDSWNLSEPPNSSFLLINESEDPELENELGSALMELDGITSITFFSAMKANFIDMISSIKMVVVVLVLSAAALAFVVLYNLSNVNISERTREIATIEVLGFTEKEVNQYVNRETLLLAAIGALAGLVLGIWLHGMIMNLAEMDDIRFGRTILPSSFVIAFVLTMVFALGINWIMKFRLRKIEMVESLKAVE